MACFVMSGQGKCVRRTSRPASICIIIRALKDSLSNPGSKILWHKRASRGAHYVEEAGHILAQEALHVGIDILYPSMTRSKVGCEPSTSKAFTAALCCTILSARCVSNIPVAVTCSSRVARRWPLACAGPYVESFRAHACTFGMVRSLSSSAM